MKPYLNKQEKSHVLTIASFIAFFEELAEKWDEMKRDTDPIGDVGLNAHVVGHHDDRVFQLFLNIL